MAIIKAVLRGINSMTTDNSSNIAIVKRMAIGLALFTLAAGCSPNPEGDGSVSGGVSGLEMATTMSVVTPVSDPPSGAANLVGLSSAQQNLSIIKPYLVNENFPVGSDYASDNTSVYAWNDSMEQMVVVNFVLCLLDDANVSGMVNQGPYVALINFTSCADEAFGDSNDQEQLVKVVVTSVRAFDSSPQFVRIWLPLAGNDPQATADGVIGGALLQLVINEAPSATAPFGRFNLSFALEADDPTGNFSIPDNLGTIKTISRGDGKSQFNFVFELGDRLVLTDDYQIQLASALLDDAAGTSGVAKTFDRSISNGTVFDSGGVGSPGLVINQQSNEVAYDASLFYRNKIGFDTGAGSSTSDQECFDRANPYFDANDYNLYHETAGTFNGKLVKAGQRVDLTTNLYFDYVQAGTGAQFYGDLSNSSFWWNGDLDGDGNIDLIPDPSTVQVTDWDTNVTSDYVIHSSEGKLDRRTGKVVLVSNLAGQKMTYGGPYSGTPSAIGGGITWDGLGRYPANFGFEQWEVEIDGGNNFVITGGKVYNTVTYQEDITPVTSANINQPVNNDVIDAPGVISGQPLQISAPSIGSLTYKEIGAVVALRRASYVVYRPVAPYEPGLNSTVLYCYSRCPIGGIAAPQDTLPAGANYWRYPAFSAPVPGGTNLDATFNLAANQGGARTYTVQVNAAGTKYQLTDNTNGLTVATTDSTNVTYSSIYSDQMILMPLLDVYHPVENNIAPYNSPYDVNNLTAGQSSYQWATGTDNWNLAHTATVGTAVGPVVRFDEPLKFNHTNILAEDRNVLLGDATVNSYDGQILNLTYDNWLSGLPWHYLPNMDTQVSVSSVNFVNGVQLIDTNGNNFVAKTRRLQEVLLPIVDAMGVSDLTSCQGALDLTVIDTLTLPGTDDLEPMLFNFSDMPIGIDGPPAVVEGNIL